MSINHSDYIRYSKKETLVQGILALVWAGLFVVLAFRNIHLAAIFGLIAMVAFFHARDMFVEYRRRRKQAKELPLAR